jgi:hypothetical protein
MAFYISIRGTLAIIWAIDFLLRASHHEFAFHQFMSLLLMQYSPLMAPFIITPPPLAQGISVICATDMVEDNKAVVNK